MSEQIKRDQKWEASYNESFKVRPYTEEELEIIEQEIPSDCSPSQKIAKLINVGKINYQRYEDAKSTNPEMTEHMLKMQIASSNFISSVIKSYQQDHGVIFDETGVINNDTLPTKQTPTVIDAEFVNRPA